MPAKKQGMTPEEQSKRFKAEVRKRVKAGEFSRTEADVALDQLVRRAAVDEGKQKD